MRQTKWYPPLVSLNDTALHPPVISYHYIVKFDQLLFFFDKIVFETSNNYLSKK